MGASTSKLSASCARTGRPTPPVAARARARPERPSARDCSPGGSASAGHRPTPRSTPTPDENARPVSSRDHAAAASGRLSRRCPRATGTCRSCGRPPASIRSDRGRQSRPISGWRKSAASRSAGTRREAERSPRRTEHGAVDPDAGLERPVDQERRRSRPTIWTRRRPGSKAGGQSGAARSPSAPEAARPGWRAGGSACAARRTDGADRRDLAARALTGRNSRKG